MSQVPEFQVETRKRNGTAGSKQLRREGLIPAVIYGRETENKNIKIEERAFTSLLQGSVSEHILVNLAVDGAKPQLVLVQDVQHNCLTDRVQHVDFHAVKASEKIHASVPVHTVGVSPGAAKGGTVQILLHTLEVFCLPKDLPELIQVDIANLDLNETFSIKDLVLPKGVEVHLDGDVGVVQVYPRRAETEEETTAGAATEPERIGEKKKEEN